MIRFFIIFSVCILLSNATRAQGEDLGELEFQHEVRGYKIKQQLYRYKKPEIENGDTIWCFTWEPGVWIYAPIKFKNERQRKAYNRLVYNVKKVLPIAQRVNSIIAETTEVLEMLPDKKAKQKHIANVEKDIWKQYEPEMKKLTYSQGKLLIKLIDRECNQSSYEIVKAFFGPAKAAVSQVFAWTFRASLKKEYQPEEDDKLIERVVRQVETGQL
jgi:Holliday junction resolvasome RuvABC endonuclease subunit